MIDAESGAVIDTLEEEFDTYEEAEEYSLVCSSDHAAGAEILRLRGEDFEDPSEVDFVVEEID